MRYAGDCEVPEWTGERKIKVLALTWAMDNQGRVSCMRKRRPWPLSKSALTADILASGLSTV